MRLSEDEIGDLGDILSHPRDALDVGFYSLRLRMSGTELFEALLDDPEQREDGDNPHGF